MDSERRSDWLGSADEPERNYDATWRLPASEEALEPPASTAARTAWYGDDWAWQPVERPAGATNGTDSAIQPVALEQDKAPPVEAIRWGALFREIAETLILTVLIFVLVRGVLVQNFRIEGYSMEPTLHEGQYLIVNKFEYLLHPPRRGDIIVFAFPRGPERDFIKRVIGLPGDTVEVRPGEILVNGEVIAEPYEPESAMYNYPPTTMGPNEYFVLGDNRNNSSDSHTWGPLDRKYIIGKAWLSYWPPQEWGLVPNYPVEARAPDAP